MAACYPGGGARYVKHVDNDENHRLCRTRMLTALIYLNESWQKGDGGLFTEIRGRYFILFYGLKMVEDVVSVFSFRLPLWFDVRRQPPMGCHQESWRSSTPRTPVRCVALWRRCRTGCCSFGRTDGRRMRRSGEATAWMFVGAVWGLPF